METFKTYKKIWKISREYYFNSILHLSLLLIIIGFTAFASASLPYIMKKIVDKSTDNELSLNLSEIFSINNLYFLIFLYALTWLVAELFQWIQRISSTYLSSAFEASLMDYGLKKFLRIKKSEIDKIDTGKFISDVRRACSSFSSINTTIFLVLVPIIVQTIFMCWYLYSTVSGLYSLFFILFAVIVFIIAKKINKKSIKYFAPLYSSRSNLDSFFLQKVSNFYDIKVNNSIKFESENFTNTLSKDVNVAFNSQFKIGLLMMVQVFIIFIFLLTFLIVSAFLFGEKVLTSGDFILISSYIITLTTPFLMLSQQINRISGNILSLQKFQAYLDLPKDKFTQAPIVESDSFYTFQNTTLNFGEKSLENFSYTLHKNKVYAIVGRTGLGKTTFVNHLLGLLKIETGNLFYKKLDISEKFSEEIFNEIAFVGQKHTLYNGTLRDNLIYNSRFKYDDIELLDLLKEFSLEDTLSNNNIELNSEIDEVYKKFSGGELQRLNLIRAILRKPQLLILDEPTSSLDEKTATQILAFLRQRVSSLIIITHAQYCIDWADEVINMNKLLEIQKNS